MNKLTSRPVDWSKALLLSNGVGYRYVPLEDQLKFLLPRFRLEDLLNSQERLKDVARRERNLPDWITRLHKKRTVVEIYVAGSRFVARMSSSNFRQVFNLRMLIAVFLEPLGKCKQVVVVGVQGISVDIE